VHTHRIQITNVYSVCVWRFEFLIASKVVRVSETLELEGSLEECEIALDAITLKIKE